MEPISNADRLVLLLRKRLEERDRARATGSARADRKEGTVAPVEPSGVRAMAAIEGSDEKPLRRAIVQNLLADQLGPKLLNDAQFQQIVTRVTDAIEEDSESAELLARVVSELRP